MLKDSHIRQEGPTTIDDEDDHDTHTISIYFQHHCLNMFSIILNVNDESEREIPLCSLHERRPTHSYDDDDDDIQTP